MKQVKVLGIRIFTGLFVFFIPKLVYAEFGLTERLNFIQKDKYKTCANCLLNPLNEKNCSVSDSNTSDESGTTTNTSADRVSGAGGTASTTGGNGYSGGGTGGGSR